jgi:AcrR family transcriptional regulator
MTASSPVRHHRRDAANTRRLLLEAARRRFAHQGYAATTVREIADDAGVNVALISRYFDSKEGLFEACLPAAVDVLSRAAGDVSQLSEVPGAIAKQVAGLDAEGHPNQLMLMLLLRSSGDERAEQMRFGVLRRFSERLAATAGWQPEDPAGEQLLLRAQLVLAASLGITLLRSTTKIEPLASATEEDLAAPLRDLVNTLLSR